MNQAEELFTLAGEQERARFLRCVDTALRDDHRLSAGAAVAAFVDESTRRDAAFLRRVSEGIGE
ncbi:hypothetical protein ABZV91_32340 [Nocardia sp. NPDC004568]|uniref:hypothetical protein n=1 Tax=Nocardia sp. NPDC004568 TaxID=3154551 RepID=UPI0033B425AA